MVCPPRQPEVQGVHLLLVRLRLWHPRRRDDPVLCTHRDEDPETVRNEITLYAGEENEEIPAYLLAFRCRR